MQSKYHERCLVSILLSMMSSITLTLTDKCSQLRASFYPEIELDELYSYSCCLLDLYTYNSIPNIDEKNNKFHFSTGLNEPLQIIAVPKGSYELNDIGDYLRQELQKKEIPFYFDANVKTMRFSIESNITIDFTRSDSIGSVLGFSKRVFDASERHESDLLVNIQSINSIRIDCDLTTGSYHNGKCTHTIYEFSPTVAPGYRILEQPKHLIYLPIVRHRINELNISIVDQDGHFVDFRGEQITCRIHIKRDQ